MKIIDIGVCVNNVDPKGIGRIRYRPYGVYLSEIEGGVSYEEWDERDPLIALPFLPAHINIIPKIQSSVKLIKYDTNKDNDIVKYITVEITKDDFDNLLRPKKLPEPKKIKSNKIDFINIPFVELIEKSFKENKPAFILFSNEDETISNDIKNKLNEDKMSVYALNNDYIPVEYINDESDQVGNIQAQDSLEISKIPSVAIIKGLETPVILDGSYSLIKKVSNFGSYFSRPDEYLETIKNLLT